MKKILMSGKCNMGEIGKFTELIDSSGHELKVGDLVSLSVYNDADPDRFEDYYGVEFICDNILSNDGCDKRMFIMGIASEHLQYEDDIGESIVEQNHKKWRIKKVKGFEKLVNGEEWGSVRAVFEE